MATSNTNSGGGGGVNGTMSAETSSTFGDPASMSVGSGTVVMATMSNVPMNSVSLTGTKFWIQIGLLREAISMDTANITMENLKEVAAAFVDRKFPENGFFDQLDKVLLFRHAPETDNILQLIKTPSQIREGNLVEIVVSESTTMEELEIRPHVLYVHSYKSPHFCDFCGEMLWGLVRQGLRCEGCGLDYHKRCAYKIPNNCTRNRSSRRASVTSLTPMLAYQVSRSSSTVEVNENSLAGTMSTPAAESMESISTVSSGNSATSTSALVSSTSSSSKSSKYRGRPVWMDKAYSGRIKVPHTFVVHNYALPCQCQHCRKLLKGIIRQGMQCKDCKFNCHKRCMQYVAKDCLGQPPSGGTETGSLDITEEPEEGETNLEEGTSPGAVDDDEDEPDEETTPKPPISPRGSNIPLMRVVQSVKNTKRTGSRYFREGWMVHCTSNDDQRRRHYWRIDAKTITMYIDENSTRYYREILLSDVQSVDKRPPHTPSVRPFVFEIKTERMIYFVGEDPAEENGDPSVISSPESGVGLDKAIFWENTIRQALMPVTNQASTQNIGSSELPRDPPSSNTTSSSHPGKQYEDISLYYHINPDDVLGSGQFGIVYGGFHRQTKTDVAIKVIDKLRFPAEKKEVLKNEVAILQNLNHPAVVNLRQMFETPERIFVIMEKMSGDMLEMILSSTKGRLTERVTKFLIAQILAALKYLHLQNIVHCDLKPENVLLNAENCLFSQIKLCDFGFARIIGDKSFRRSIVGTPAYLAPEVLKSKQGYNRSLDMWSVGVIVYVSLSGTFPFNEDEDISDQIQNAGFMYPANPWRDISPNAIAIINNLLQVKMRKRFSVAQALCHIWLQDYRTWCDLRKLEQEVGQRYLTHECDDQRWEDFRRANNHRQWEILGHQEIKGAHRLDEQERYTYRHVDHE